MLVETCSNIGQELTKSSKPTPVPSDQRKHRTNASPSHSSKPNTPKSDGPSPLASQQLQKPVPQQQTKMVPGGVGFYGHNQNLASLATQYQMMYQQLLYQTEMEMIRAKEIAAQQKALGALGVLSTESSSKQACPMCSATPGYSGHCVHDELAINPLLAMFNPSLAAYGKMNEQAALAQASLLSKVRVGKGSSLSPPAAHSSRRSPSKTPSPKSAVANADQAQPIDLHVPQATAPHSLTTKECHWVGGGGYCGKKFTTQDQLMEHLKVHVSTSAVADSSRLSPPSPKDSSNKSSLRFQPYSFTERNILSLRHWVLRSLFYVVMSSNQILQYYN